MILKNITDKEFKRYGKIFKGVACDDMVAYMNAQPLPQTGTEYVPSVPELEAMESAKKIVGSLFGDMPVEIGYCVGHNSTLNALEYHRDSEVCIACTDLIVVYGKQDEIEDDDTFDTGLAKAFFVPKGTVFETYATTLHYAPWGVDGSGFQNIVCLPKGTNTPLDERVPGCEEDKMLLARNKWVLAHEEAGLEGAWTGLVGKNLTYADIEDER